jgi:phospholipid/cholesterol/gamma-HCH transport system permease protein
VAATPPAAVNSSPGPHLLERFNESAKRNIQALQEFFVLSAKAIGFAFSRPFYRSDLIQQMDSIGVQSLPIVLLTGFFTGMVLALQSSVQLKTFGATMYIGRLVAASMIRELGPVLAGLMGSMRVTEQIDALNTLGTDPIRKLVTPRVLAALIMMPTLTVINDFAGILGGNVIAAAYVGIPTSLYWRTVWEQIAGGGFIFKYIPNDFVHGLVKPFVFGGIISLVACNFGLKTSGGTEGVGVSTTRTVVTASILILVVDYFITQLLLAFLPA